MVFDYVVSILKSRFNIEPDVVNRLPRDLRKVDTPCFNCGSNTNIWCFFLDYTSEMKYVDFAWRFYHICLNCGYIDYGSITGTCYDGFSWPTRECPICREYSRKYRGDC